MQANDKTQWDGESEKKCIKCGGSRILSGRLFERFADLEERILFRADDISTFHPLSLLSPDVRVQPKSMTCLDCGCLWSSVDPMKLNVVIKKYGNDQLKELL